MKSAIEFSRVAVALLFPIVYRPLKVAVPLAPKNSVLSNLL